jgi:sulfide:quinone oxidoreductase
MKKRDVNWDQTAVASFNPDANEITLADGRDVSYDYLIVAPGIQLRFDLIEGSKEALDDPTCPVGSIYTLDGAYKTSVLRENFKGGRAIFNLPTMPIKCGGGPQKIMYLSEETFRKNGVRDNTEILWHTTVGNLFPNCLKFAEALVPIAESKGINITYQSQLVKIDKDNRVATFKSLASGDLTDIDFDFLHFAPPQTPGEFIRSSPLAHANGFLDVN